MKDYSVNSNDRENYILSYEIKNGEIEVKVADGTVGTVPYRKENEEWIIRKMENQALNARVAPFPVIDKVFAIIQPLLLPLSVFNFVVAGGLLNGIALAIILGGTIYYPANWIRYMMKEKDIVKLKYFLENKQELNDYVENEENVLFNVSDKAKLQIMKEQYLSHQSFNINNIDNYSLEDLVKIKKNIENLKKSMEIDDSKDCSEKYLSLRIKPNKKH